MTHYKVLTFNHANLKRPVHIVAGTVSGFHFSKPTECMIIYTTGGVFPVEESEEEIKQIIESLNGQVAKGE